MGQIDPELPYVTGSTNGRCARESGLLLKRLKRQERPSLNKVQTRRFDPSRSRSAPPNASNTLSEQPFSAAAVWDIKPEPRGREDAGIIVTTTPRASPGQHRNAGHSSTAKERSAP